MIRASLESNLPPPEETDQQIVDKILRGEANDYRILVKRHQDVIYRMHLKQTGDSATAHDLAQETFIKAFEKLSSFRGEAQFLTWLTRLAINLSNNYFSSKEYKQRCKTLTPIDNQHCQASVECSLEEKLVLLREFIGELKPKFRNVITLCGLEKKSYEEAALILAIPVGTVRSRLHEARTQLKERFKTEAKDL